MNMEWSLIKEHKLKLEFVMFAPFHGSVKKLYGESTRSLGRKWSMEFWTESTHMSLRSEVSPLERIYCTLV